MKKSEQYHQNKSTYVRGIAVRARYTEELIKKLTTENNITQIVNAAAGLDTYAWRINLPNNIKYFEIDYQDILQWKIDQLKDEKLKLNMKPVFADLSSDDWSFKLMDAGFDSELSFFQYFVLRKFLEIS